MVGEAYVRLLRRQDSDVIIWNWGRDSNRGVNAEPVNGRLVSILVHQDLLTNSRPVGDKYMQTRRKLESLALDRPVPLTAGLA